jgi:hypothetical protein
MRTMDRVSFARFRDMLQQAIAAHKLAELAAFSIAR